MFNSSIKTTSLSQSSDTFQMKTMKTLKKITLLKRKKIRIMRCALWPSHLNSEDSLKSNRRGVSLILISIDRTLYSNRHMQMIIHYLLMKRHQVMKKKATFNNSKSLFNSLLLLNLHQMNLFSKNNQSQRGKCKLEIELWSRFYQWYRLTLFKRSRLKTKRATPMCRQDKINPIQIVMMRETMRTFWRAETWKFSVLVFYMLLKYSLSGIPTTITEKICLDTGGL